MLTHNVPRYVRERRLSARLSEDGTIEISEWSRPDIILVHAGRPYFLEVKRPGTYQSREQKLLQKERRGGRRILRCGAVAGRCEAFRPLLQEASFAKRKILVVCDVCGADRLSGTHDFVSFHCLMLCLPDCHD